MTTRPQLGKNIYKQELAKGRLAAEAIRKALTQLIDEPGPQTRAILIAKAAVSLSEIESMLGQLEDIGRNAKE